MRRDINPLDLLPNFEAFQYQLVARPSTPRFADVWDKLEETERRLGWLGFVCEHCSEAQPRHRQLLDDAASAFVMTFEAALQVLMHHGFARDSNKLEQWLATRHEYSLAMRGTRALRVRNAHLESTPIGSQITAVAGGAARSVKRSWHLPEITAQQFKVMTSRKLREGDLAAWETFVKSRSATTILSDALKSLSALVIVAEALPP